MSLLAIAPEIPTQTPGVLSPQKYKSWLTIDSKNSNVTEIVSQLGIASALFSAGETRVKKSRGGAGNFYLVGHIWENGYLSYWRDSANSVACVAGAKRGGRWGGRKARKRGKGREGPFPSLPPPPPPFFPFSLSPTPFDACYACYNGECRRYEKLNDLFQLNKKLLTFVENYQLSLYFSVQYMVWESFNWHQIFSLRASSPFGGYREKYTRENNARGDATLAASPLARAFSRGSLRSPK